MNDHCKNGLHAKAKYLFGRRMISSTKYVNPPPKVTIYITQDYYS